MVSFLLVILLLVNQINALRKYNTQGKIVKGAINVHLVPHSHGMFYYIVLYFIVFYCRIDIEYI